MLYDGSHQRQHALPYILALGQALCLAAWVAA